MSPRKILAIKLRALGDTVLMTAPLAELRMAYKEAEIHALVHTPWAPIIESHPSVDRIWTYDRHTDRAARAKALARLGYKLRKEKYDCVVCFHASPSSSLLAFATGARIRSIHFHGHKDRNRYSTVTVPGKGVLKPVIERDMDTIRALGIHVPAGRLPIIPIQPAERALGASRLSRLNLPTPVLGIGLGASRPTKGWPIERFAALAIAWCQRRQGGAIAFAGPHEQATIHQFLNAIDDLLSSSIESASERAQIRSRIAAEHQLGLKPLAAVLSALSVFVGNDSGPRHIAVAVGTPTVTLFGPEHPFEWHPYPVDRHPYLYVDGLACRRDADPGKPAWCALHECVAEQHKCMRSLGIDQTLDECIKVAAV